MLCYKYKLNISFCSGRCSLCTEEWREKKAISSKEKGYAHN